MHPCEWSIGAEDRQCPRGGGARLGGDEEARMEATPSVAGRLVLGSVVLLPPTERPARQMPFIERYSSLPSAHNPRMPSVSESKSAKYPQLSHGVFTTPA